MRGVKLFKHIFLTWYVLFLFSNLKGLFVFPSIWNGAFLDE